MNFWLAYHIAVSVGLFIALAWAYDARRMLRNIVRLARMRQYDQYDLPTEEIELPSYQWPPFR